MVSAGLEDPAPLGKAKIKGNLSSMLPTGGLLERAPNLKMDQSASKF